jgi:hypothetical protein
VTAPYRWQDDQPLDGCEFADRIQPGTTVLNSMYQLDDPEVLNVAHVSAPDADGMVTIHDVTGFELLVNSGMCFQIMTSELADLIGFLVTAEQARLRLQGPESPELPGVEGDRP